MPQATEPAVLPGAVATIIGGTLRRARGRVTVAFAVAGVLCGVVAAGVPALAHKLDLSAGQVGAVLFAWGLAAFASMQSLRLLLPVAGHALVLRAAGPACAVGAAAMAVAPGFGPVLAAATGFGVAFGALEAAVNAQGAAVERAYGRPLLNGMHAAWAVGAGAAGVFVAVCTHLAVSYTVTVAAVAVLVLPLTLLAGPPSQDMPLPARRRGSLPPAVYLLSVLAFAAFMVEGTFADWCGLLLRDGAGASATVAALGHPLLQAGILTGRAVADRLRARAGAAAVIVWCGTAVAVACALLVVLPAVPVVLAAVYVTGVAVSPVLPLVFSLAGTARPDRAEAAIAQVGAAGYAGLLAGPAVLGAVGGIVPLPAAIGGLAVVLGIAIALLGRRAGR
ncbi:MFS transporter [Dactylosporangium sp. NPDC049525]|uniref:MFS transporter n=1 Tax=Dactylosporangium sp. NPDC049525 TaxID=3154730 RepID=UPI0034310EB2